MLVYVKYPSYIRLVRLRDMLVKELIKELEKMNGELPVVWGNGFNPVEVVEAKESVIRRKAILK